MGGDPGGSKVVQTGDGGAGRLSEVEMAGLSGEGEDGGEDAGVDGGEAETADGVQGAQGEYGAFGVHGEYGALGVQGDHGLFGDCVAIHGGGGGEKQRDGLPRAIATAAANAVACEPPAAVADAWAVATASEFPELSAVEMARARALATASEFPYMTGKRM